MIDSLTDYVEITFFHSKGFLTFFFKLQFSFQDEECFIFVGVIVPGDVLSFDLGELYKDVVDLADDFWRKIIPNGCELFVYVHVININRSRLLLRNGSIRFSCSSRGWV